MPRVPPPRSPEKSPAPLPAACRAALQLLLQAHDYAADLSLNGWDFALELGYLNHAGIGNSELRWLACKGYVEHAQDCSLREKEERQFQHTGKLLLSERSCFVLTTAGLSLARVTSSPSIVPPLLPDKAPTGIPRYQAELKELTLDGELVKRFKVPAPNQELILTAFEEEGWPPHLDDPLPPLAELDPKKRLNDAIRCLNRNQKRHVLRFMGAGNGRGLRWEGVTVD